MTDVGILYPDWPVGALFESIRRAKREADAKLTSDDLLPENWPLQVAGLSNLNGVNPQEEMPQDRKSAIHPQLRKILDSINNWKKS